MVAKTFLMEVLLVTSREKTSENSLFLDVLMNNSVSCQMLLGTEPSITYVTHVRTVMGFFLMLPQEVIGLKAFATIAGEQAFT